MTVLEALQAIEEVLCQAHSTLSEALRIIGEAKKRVQAAIDLGPPANITTVLLGVKETLCFTYDTHHEAAMAIESSKSQIQLAIMSL